MIEKTDETMATCWSKRTGTDRGIRLEAVSPKVTGATDFLSCSQLRVCGKIARDWNSSGEDTGYLGYVTEFSVEERYVSKFEIQTVGSSIHKELWIPAEELDVFIDNIVNLIEIVATYSKGSRLK